MSDKIYIWQSEESDSCDECKNLNGKVFTNKDDSPSPPLHPNCKCKLVEVEKKEPPLCLTNRAIGSVIKSKFEAFKANTAADLLNHFYNGNGEPVILQKEFIEASPQIQEGVERNEYYLKEITFKGYSKPVKEVMEKIKNNIPNKYGKVSYPIQDHWDFDKTNSYSYAFSSSKTDTAFSLGSFKLKSEFKGDVERDKDIVRFKGIITHTINDVYDFGPIYLNEYLAQETGCAIPFEVKGKWQEEVTGSASIDSRGNIDHSAIRRFKKKYYEEVF